MMRSGFVEPEEKLSCRISVMEEVGGAFDVAEKRGAQELGD